MDMLPEDALRLARKLQNEGRSRQEAQEEVAKRLVETLSPEQSETLRRLTGDRDAIERLLSSRRAQELMKLFNQER